MDYNEIKFLLEKYIEGNTSLAEEALLKEYFAQGNIHADFEEWKPMFDFFSSEENLTTSEGFEAKILSKIKEEKKAVKTFKMNWLKVAAVFILLLGAAGIIYKSIEKRNIAPQQTVAQIESPKTNATEISDTYTNPEDAKKAVEQALALLSKHMNKGKNMAAKNIDKLDVLNKAIDN